MIATKAERSGKASINKIEAITEKEEAKANKPTNAALTPIKARFSTTLSLFLKNFIFLIINETRLTVERNFNRSYQQRLKHAHIFEAIKQPSKP